MHTVVYDLSILATGYRFRGIGRYVSELARGLDALEAEREEAGLRLVYLEGFDRLGRPLLSSRPESALERFEARPPVHAYRQAYASRLGIGRAARAANAALVHLGFPGATPLARGGALRVVTCHDLIPLRFPEHYRAWSEGYAVGRRWLDRRRYHSADHVIAVSRSTAEDLTALLGVPPSKVSVVSSGIDAKRWSSQARPEDARELAALGLGERPFVVYAGDADYRKNSAGMFAALALANRELPAPGLSLVWAAKLSSARRRRLDAETARAGVADSVRFTGHLSDAALGALYRSAIATLFVSLWEGFGFPVLEAMANACPVITSDRSSTREVGEGAAELVDPEDHAAIANALVRVASDVELRAKLRERGLRRAGELGLERQARGTLDVYRKRLTGRN
ncbi:MAG TPA: glycosyltransferase family 1 protein [Polyangiaceae bacterium]